MKLSRKTAAVALASALVLTACTGGDAAEDTTTPATAGATTEDQDAATASGDDAATTSAAPDAAANTADAAARTDDGSTAEMTTDPAQAALSVEDAERVAATVLDARLESLKTDGKKASAARKAAFDGPAGGAASAANKTESVFGESPEAKAKEPASPNVLAVSRADGELPVVLLVQTVPVEDEAPLLHLMESRTGKVEDFRITWEATMLPGTTLPTFDRRSVGTPLVRGADDKDGEDLLTAPKKTLEQLAEGLSWPRPEDFVVFRTNGYRPAVNRASEAQADSVAAQATLTEENTLRPDTVTTLLFEDGSAFVTGAIQRDTTFTVKENSILNPPESFRIFVDDGELRNEAVLRTTVMVGMRVPSKDVDFQPEVIAVREQLIGADGS